MLDDEAEILATYELLREFDKRLIVTSLALEKHTKAMKDDKNYCAKSKADYCE